MPNEFQRTHRVADALQKEISRILQREVRDPRIAMTTICAVEVSKDLSYAKIFVSMMAEEDELVQSMAALKGASGHIRSLLAKTMKLRVVPELRFVYDESIARGRHLSSLIDSAVTSDAKIKGQKSNGESE